MLKKKNICKKVHSFHHYSTWFLAPIYAFTPFWFSFNLGSTQVKAHIKLPGAEMKVIKIRLVSIPIQPMVIEMAFGCHKCFYHQSFSCHLFWSPQIFHCQSFDCQHFWSPLFLDATQFSFIKSLVANKFFWLPKFQSLHTFFNCYTIFLHHLQNK